MILELNKVKVEFDNKVIIETENEIFRDGFYCIKGINGSGKSTLLKAIAGLVKHTGKILVNNQSYGNSINSYLKQISYAEAEPVFPNFISGLDVLNFTCYTRKTSLDIVLDSAKKIDAYYFLHQSVQTYSSGMLKKVGLLLALCLHKKNGVLLLDEPFITLDSNSIHTLQHVLIDWQKEHNACIIFVNHQSMNYTFPISKYYIIENNFLKSINE